MLNPRYDSNMNSFLGILKVRGDGDGLFCNFQFLCNVLLFLDVKEVMRMTRVSKGFRNAARSDVVWKEIMSKKNEYFSRDLTLYSDFEGLDYRTGNLCSKVEMMIKRSFYQAKCTGSGERSVTGKLEKVGGSKAFFLFFSLVSATSIFCPHLGVLLHGLIAHMKYYELEEKDPVRYLIPVGSSIDVILSCLITCYGWCVPCCILQCLSSCCFGCGLLAIPGLFTTMCAASICACIHSPNYAFIHMVMWLGRFYFLSEEGLEPEEEVAAILSTSPFLYVVGSLFGFDWIYKD